MVLELPDVVLVSTYGYDALRPEIDTGALARVRAGAYVAASDLDVDAWKHRHLMTLAGCVAVAGKFTTPFAFGVGTGAVLRGWIDVLRDHRPHVMQTVNPGAGHPRDVVRHVSRDFRSEEITLVAGLPVMPVVQTIVDCARLLEPDEALAVVDGAFRVEAGMTPFKRAASQARQLDLRTRAQERLKQQGPVRGAPRARMILEVADGFAANAAESRMRWIALRYGLPMPVCQREFWVDGQQYFGDAVWTVTQHGHERLVIAEFDGALKYRGSEGSKAVVREKKREDAIRRRHRAEFARLDWPLLHRPDAALREILEAFPPGTVPMLEPRQELQLRPPRAPRPSRRPPAPRPSRAPRS